MYWYVGSAGALTGGLSDECAGGRGSFELPVLNWRYSRCNISSESVIYCHCTHCQIICSIHSIMDMFLPIPSSPPDCLMHCQTLLSH
jgi:hypothetical protein